MTWERNRQRVMKGVKIRSLKPTPEEATAASTISASRTSSNGRASDRCSDLTLSRIHRRVAWGMVGLLDGRDRVVFPPILVPRRPTSVQGVSQAGVTENRVPFASGTVSESIIIFISIF